jgi:hypothetical protein
MGFKRLYLSAEGLLNTVRHSLERETFKVLKNTEYTWQDCIMSRLAVFGFKSPSLLQFEKQKHTVPLNRRNLRKLYRVDKVPSDTCLQSA